ncbi:Phospholipase_D-nuclease N-terminal [Arachidicoccus rhizosphaerae]|uniref:Phospholipase_D-nuclease N-terminal n=1 Tax=Arachidicoccus rhizosphaerae TaxID=551991 RepID=A0A1H3W8G5_9BACT|nr:PLDc N-terminal domain-containing protein [Arachidicoccus rhizosphaerae]SDZ83280.1 Phospholipase_D-nuclease N-terminal [Arachidicoccus rhizosphaerae]
MSFVSIQQICQVATSQPQPRSIVPLIIFFGVIPLAFMAYCLKDILPKTYSGNLKKVWIILIIILPMLGPLLYLFIGQDKATR